MFAQIAADRLLRKLDGIDSGSLDLTLPNGRTESFSGKNPGMKAKIKLNNWKVLSNLAMKGDTGFAVDYQNGNWETDNLQNLLTFGLMNEASTEAFISGNQFFNTLSRLNYFFKRNSLSGSRRNIHAHYDLGNDFYKIWLDETMTYSSALFKSSNESLSQAQNNKYDRLLDKLDTTSGDILEIGCGWGGFADRAVQSNDVSVTGVTISDAQYEYSQKRLGDRAQVKLQDYRTLTGTYDHIVSIEMFEAVGQEYWQTYFAKVKNLLKDKGKAMIQTITIADDKFDKYSVGSDVIRNFIFPGGMLPSPSRFKHEAEIAGFRQNETFFFGLDYARTLEIWLENFDNRINEIKTQGFDEKFIRMWRFYLASCIAGFKTGRINVMQVELQNA